MTMKKVTGQYNREYVLNQQSGKIETDGISYQVQNMEGMWVKILNDNSKAKQLEIERLIQAGLNHNVYRPIEIVYGREKFVGYVYRETAPYVSEKESYQSFHDDQYNGNNTEGNTKDYDIGMQTIHNNQKSFVNTPVFKVFGAILVGTVLCLLNMKLFHGIYLGLLSQWFEEPILSYSILITCYGALSCIGGVILMGICAHFWKDSHGVIFLLLEVCSYLIGMIVVDLLIVILIVLLFRLLQLAKSILPLVISFVFVILMVKIFVKWLRKLFR